MKYILLISLALLALTSASSLRQNKAKPQKSLIQAKTGMKAIDWKSEVPYKCQLLLYTEANFQGSESNYGTDTDLTFSTNGDFKSFKISHGCKIAATDNEAQNLTFAGEVSNIEDYGWYKRTIQITLMDTDKKCTVRLYEGPSQIGSSVDIYSSNPNLATTAAFSNLAQSYKLWGCQHFQIRAYPYANYIGYLDLHSGNSHTTFATGISSIKMVQIAVPTNSVQEDANITV